MVFSDTEVTLIDYMGGDLAVANAARVSFSKQVEEFSDKDARLIQYLADHNHWTPFSHTSLTFRIKAPIFVARQLFKHKVGGTENEVSRRYVDSEPEFFLPECWRERAENVKQGSGDDIHPQKSQMADTALITAYTASKHAYDTLLELGVCPEQARMALPQGMMTEWIWTGSLAFFARVINQRLDPHAQLESSTVARRIKEAIEATNVFTYSLGALTRSV